MFMQIYGICVLAIGASLQQFAMSRKHSLTSQKNCNDSKATLLLYYTTGLSCEIIAIGLISFFHFVISSILYEGSSHVLFLSIFWHRAEKLQMSFPSVIGNSFIFVGIL